MSKTFAENSVTTVLKAFSKQFGALVTGYVHKYRYDPFLRTEINTIALLIFFSLFILVTVGISSGLLYHDVISAMSQAISESILSDSPPSLIGSSVVTKLEGLQSRNTTILFLVVIVVTIIVGYFISRVVLSPARNALESQKQFIGNVAHELRTPLSNIKTGTEIALLNPATDKETETLLISTVEELNRISDIINNLLSLSSSVRPERVEFQDEDLGLVVESSMRKLRELAERKSLGMTARLSERRLVWGNATALEQIVTNILKNAIMFTPQGGHVSVTVEPVYPDFMELTVQDSGMGIGRKDLFRIFEPFYRAERSRNRANGGVGLGLPIVSELVKLHHGKITVRSVEKQGTTVVVLLPAGKQRPGASALSKQGRENVGEIAVDFSRGSDRANET